MVAEGASSEMDTGEPQIVDIMISGLTFGGRGDYQRHGSWSPHDSGTTQTVPASTLMTDRCQPAGLGASGGQYGSGCVYA